MTDNRVAIFVDGDNVSSTLSDHVLKIAQKEGSVVHAVTYVNNNQLNNGWVDHEGYSHQCTGSGKNATDFFIAMEAAKLHALGKYDLAVVVTNDKDFLHPIRWLTQNGVSVLVISKDLNEDKMRDVNDVRVIRIASKMDVDLILQDPEQRDLSVGRNTLLRKAAIKSMLAEQRGRMSLQEFGTMMHERHKITPGMLGSRRWHSYFSSRTHDFEVRGEGENAWVIMRTMLPQEPAERPMNEMESATGMGP